MRTRWKKWLGELFRFFKLTIREYLDVKCSDKAAALAYYTAFSLAPLAVIAVAIAGMVFGKAAAGSKLSLRMQRMVGTETAEVLEEMAVKTADLGAGIPATVIGVGFLVWGASQVFNFLQTSLAEIWAIDSSGEGWKQGVLEKARSFVLVAGAGFFLLMILFVSTAVATLVDLASRIMHVHVVLVEVVNYTLTFLVFAASFAALFRFLSRKALAWRDVVAGALMTSVMFVLGQWVVRMYLSYAGTKSALGAAGAFAVFLLWLDYMAQITLMGAVMTHVYSREYGSYAAKKRAEKSEAPKDV